MLTDPADPEAQAPLGALMASEGGARVRCELCGRWYAKLGYHVRMGHGVDPAVSRERFGLNAETGLVSPALRRRLSELHRDHLARVRPAVSIFAALTPEERARNASGPRRAERRRHLGEARRRHLAARPPAGAERPPAGAGRGSGA